MASRLQNSEYVGRMDLMDWPTHTLLDVKQGKAKYVQAIPAINFHFSHFFSNFFSLLF